MQRFLRAKLPSDAQQKMRWLGWAGNRISRMVGFLLNAQNAKKRLSINAIN